MLIPIMEIFKGAMISIPFALGLLESSKKEDLIMVVHSDNMIERRSLLQEYLSCLSAGDITALAIAATTCGTFGVDYGLRSFASFGAGRIVGNLYTSFAMSLIDQSIEANIAPPMSLSHNANAARAI